MIDNYVWSEAEDFAKNPVSMQEGAFVYITRPVCSLFEIKIPNSWTGRYGSENWQPKSTDFTSLDLSSGDL